MSEYFEVGGNSEAEAQEKLLAADEEKEKTRAYLHLALTRFKTSAEAEKDWRTASLDDFKFSTGDQWPSDIRADRDLDHRPCLTMDHLSQSIKQVTNELREDRPAIQIDPAGSGATRKVADVLQGICRHIEIISDADVHYDTAGDHMVRGGIGFLRIYTEYLPDSFDQEVYIESIRNPFAVYSDPFGVKHDHSDHRFKFIVQDLPRAEFEKKYPGTAAAGLNDFVSVGDLPAPWISKETVRIADYYYLDDEEYDLYKLPDGSVTEELDEDQKQFVNNPVEGEPKIDHRKATRTNVMYAKITATDIIEGPVKLPGTAIPIIPAVGDDLDINGKPYRAGLVRNAKEPQKMYNYQCSAATEQVALAPRAPFIGHVGQFKSKESDWKNLNRRNFAYLEVDPVMAGGTLAPLPQRDVAEPPIQATVMLIRQAGDDLKAAMGMYDASLGQPGPEQSGKAILARQKQGDKATLNFSDNLRRTVRAVGRLLIEWVRATYTAPRIQRIINPEQGVGHAGIFNSDQSDYSPEEALEELQTLDPAIKEVFDIGTGRFSVVVTTGPSYQSKRQEAVASIMALVQSYPALMEIAGDLLISNMDWPYADIIAKRLKKRLPPDLLQDDNTPEGQTAMLKSQLNQMGQQNQLLTRALTDATELIKTKMLELNSKERIALIGAQSGLIEAALKGHSAGALEQLRAVMGAIQSRLDLTHEQISIESELQADKERASHEASLQPPEDSTGQGGSA